ncbi:MAG: hypothetical protein RR342_03715 [Bacilli bacterium]
MENNTETTNLIEDEQIVKQDENGRNKVNSEALEDELKHLCYDMKVNDKAKKAYEKKLDDQKKRFKEIVAQLDTDKFEDEDVKVSMSTIDKSYLDPDNTLAFLKENNLNEYIHIKEFFDYSELTMAATQNKINPKDLSQFVIKKFETRITIK